MSHARLVSSLSAYGSGGATRVLLPALIPRLLSFGHYGSAAITPHGIELRRGGEKPLFVEADSGAEVQRERGWFWDGVQVAKDGAVRYVRGLRRADADQLEAFLVLARAMNEIQSANDAFDALE